MRKSKSEPVGDLVRMFLRQEGLETPYNEYKLIQNWERVVGGLVARQTGKLFIKNQTLFAEIRSAVLKQELIMRRRMYVERLNAAAGAQVITDIRFY